MSLMRLMRLMRLMNGMPALLMNGIINGMPALHSNDAEMIIDPNINRFM